MHRITAVRVLRTCAAGQLQYNRKRNMSRMVSAGHLRIFVLSFFSESRAEHDTHFAAKPGDNLSENGRDQHL